MEIIEKIGRELIEINKQYKEIDTKLKLKKEEITKLFLIEDCNEKVIEEFKISKIPENKQERVVKKETLINVISEKVEDPDLAGIILSEILKDSKIKSHIKVTKA